ncbi:MAG: hypothetical protein ABI175_25590, partial [Polyangiales bacterium]
RTGEYVAALVTIDGVDRVTGVVVAENDLDRRHRSYSILPPYTYMQMRGFVVGRTKLSTFRFTEPEQALATRKGDASGVGRIDVQFYPLVRASTPPAPAPAAAPTEPAAESDDAGYVKAPAAPRAPDGVFGAVFEEHYDTTVGERFEIAPNAVLLRRMVLTYGARAGARLGTAGPPPSAEAVARAERPVATNTPSAPEDDDDLTQIAPGSEGKLPPKSARGPKPSKPSKGDVAPVKTVKTTVKTTKAPKPSSAAGVK